MRRTEQLQGLRLMKFEDVYGRCYRGDLSQAEASEILGMSERTFRRWRERYEAEGAEGLYDRRLGRVAGTIRRNKHRDDRARGRLQNPLAQNDVRAGEPSRRWEARWNKWKGQVLAVAGGQWTRRRNSGISSGSSPGSWPLTGPIVCTITLGPIPPVNSARRENPGLSG